MTRYSRNLLVAPFAAILICLAYCFAFGVVDQACALEQPVQPDAAIEHELDLDVGDDGVDGLVGSEALANSGALENAGVEKPGKPEVSPSQGDEGPLSESDNQNGDKGSSLEPASGAGETPPTAPEEDQDLVVQGESRPTVTLTASTLCVLTAVMVTRFTSLVKWVSCCVTHCLAVSCTAMQRTLRSAMTFLT